MVKEKMYHFSHSTPTKCHACRNMIKMTLNAFAENTGQDQSAHASSLIRVFASRLQNR